MTQLRLGLIGLGAMCSRIATRLLRSGFSLQICDMADVALCTFNMDVDMVDAPALGTTEDAKAGKLTFFLGGADTAIERSRPIFETLGERILRAGAARSGQAAIALADFLRGLALTAATEA